MARVDLELQDSKIYKKVVTLCGEDFAKELMNKSEADLRSLISNNTLKIEEAVDGVNANTDYLKAKDVTDTFKEGLRNTTNPLKAAIKLSIKVIESLQPPKS